MIFISIGKLDVRNNNNNFVFFTQLWLSKLAIQSILCDTRFVMNIIFY